MPKPYSMDLRERVAAYVEAGHSRRTTAAHFSVSPSFVINLMTALRERGGLAPKPLGGRRHAKLEPHRDYLLRRGEGQDASPMTEAAGEILGERGGKARPPPPAPPVIRNTPRPDTKALSA